MTDDLEERVEDLKAEIKDANKYIEELRVERDAAQHENDMLVSVIRDLHDSVPREPFEDFYRRLHPNGPGSNPDLQVVAQSSIWLRSQNG